MELANGGIYFNLLKVLYLQIFLKPLQPNPFPIKHRVCEIINPIPHDSRQSMVASLVLHGLVLVAKDEKVDGWVKLGLLLCVLIKAGLRDIIVITTLHLVFQFFQAVFVRPFQGQTDAKVRMN